MTNCPPSRNTAGQAYRDPELAELMGDDSADEQAGVATLLHRARNAGEIDTALDPDETAAWIMAMIGAVYLRGATDPTFVPAQQLRALRLTVERLLRASTAAPET